MRWNISAVSSLWPCALLNDVGTPVAIISQLDTRPACAPANASMAASWLSTHDSGSGWLATPFLCDSCIHDSTPVYPGALSKLLVAGGSQFLACHGDDCISRDRHGQNDPILGTQGGRRM